VSYYSSKLLSYRETDKVIQEIRITLQLARAYVAADRAWWSSLVTPPFNKYKDNAHWALDAARHQCFLAFGAGIQVAREMVAK